ncbi:Reverse transcriptase domain [Trinorchestia longiramus]|nr:Reverse transcriptase domain [Trinorchestia longiramus]
MATHSVLIAAIQETKLSLFSKPRAFPTYSFVRRDRPPSRRAGGSGLAFLIHHSIFYSLLPSDHLFPDSPTRLPSNGNPSSPDLTIASPHLALETSWTPLTRLNSDHLPIAISFSTKGGFHPSYPPNYCQSLHPQGLQEKFHPESSLLCNPFINQRDLLRSTNPNDPSLPDLNNNITSAISTHSGQTWIDKVQSHGLQQNLSKFWSLLKSLSGKSNNQPPNQPITFGNRVTTSNPIISQSFCRQFTTVPHFQPGLDNLTILHIRHLGPSGISYLTNTNLSLSNTTIPSIWKTAIIITILKPGKPPSLSSSYRPISLLCPAVKVLERLLLLYLTAVTPLSDSQHGFRLLHSTTSALLPLSHTIAVGFNQHRTPLRTTIMAIDFSKVFDTVPPQLISQISSLPLNHHIVRRLVCYLKGRSAKCYYHHHLSSSRPVLAGVPQGSVISPTLFNLFVSDYPLTPPPLTTSYADDFTALTTTTKIPDASAILSAHSADVPAWVQQ